MHLIIGLSNHNFKPLASLILIYGTVTLLHYHYLIHCSTIHEKELQMLHKGTICLFTIYIQWYRLYYWNKVRNLEVRIEGSKCLIQVKNKFINGIREWGRIDLDNFRRL